MSTGGAIRSRSVAVDQGAMSSRLGAFRKKNGASAQILFHRQHGDLTKLQFHSMHTDARSTVARQAVAQSVSASADPHSSRATLHVKAKESPRASLLPAQASPSLALPSGSASVKMQAFLFNPVYQPLRDARMPEIARKSMSESVDFLRDLQDFRNRPTLEKANYIKATYIDSANQDFDFSSVSADSFGKATQSKALNITGKHQSQFNDEFASSVRHLQRGDSIQQSGLIHAFNAIEEHIAHMVLRNVSL